MARDLLRVRIDLANLHCYDEGDGWGVAEPYLWTVFFKIDGETVALSESLTLTGEAVVQPAPGSHGNLGTSDVDAGDDVAIPDVLGDWTPILKPIPVPDSLRPLVGDDLPGIAGVVCVLMEEDNVSDAGADAGHEALNGAVKSALDEIIATRSFSNPDITDEEIAAYMDDVQAAVEEAVADQQNFFENAWSFINPDDTIGTKVFYFTHDELAGSVIPMSQRWKDEGDWEITGSATGTVICPAEALAAIDEAFAKSFGDVGDRMRRFRDEEFGGGNALGLWWQLFERNSPQLKMLASQDESIGRSWGRVMQTLVNRLDDRGRQLSEELLEEARGVLQHLQRAGNRRMRLDASRVLSLMEHLGGKTVAEGLELVSKVPPGRYPRPFADVRKLLNDDAPAPKTLLDPSLGRLDKPG